MVCSLRVRERSDGVRQRVVCRYVVEICYTRVKDWKLLAGEIPRENFHLMNSAWWWALGHANMCRGMLVPPPGVEDGVPPLYHYSQWLDGQQ